MTTPTTHATHGWNRATTWLLVAVVAGVSIVLHEIAPRFTPDPLILAAVLGLVVGNLLPACTGRSVVARRIVDVTMAWAILMLGAGLNLGILTDERLGIGGLGITIVSMIVGYFACILAGRLFGATAGASTLMGAGTAICGNVAIVAVAPTIRAKDADVAVSIASVNLCGVILMLSLPAIAKAIGLSPSAGGIWMGATIHAIPQAIAAGHALDGAGEIATLFKMARVALLMPTVVFITIAFARRTDGPTPVRGWAMFRLVPWFVWGFVGTAILRTMGWLDGVLPTAMPLVGGDSLASSLEAGGHILLTCGMAAIGLDLRIMRIIRVGGPAILAGLAASIIMAGVCVGLLLLIAPPTT